MTVAEDRKSKGVMEAGGLMDGDMGGWVEYGWVDGVWMDGWRLGGWWILPDSVYSSL